MLQAFQSFILIKLTLKLKSRPELRNAFIFCIVRIDNFLVFVLEIEEPSEQYALRCNAVLEALFTAWDAKLEAGKCRYDRVIRRVHAEGKCKRNVSCRHVASYGVTSPSFASPCNPIDADVPEK